MSARRSPEPGIDSGAADRGGRPHAGGDPPQHRPEPAGARLGQQCCARRVNELTDWRRQIAEHRKELIAGAAVAGFVIGGIVALRRRRRRCQTPADCAPGLHPSSAASGTLSPRSCWSPSSRRPVPDLPVRARDRAAADRGLLRARVSAAGQLPQPPAAALARDPDRLPRDRRCDLRIGLLIVPPLVDGVEDLSADLPGYVEDLRENETFREYDDDYQITDKLKEQAERAAQPARRRGRDAARRHRRRLLRASCSSSRSSSSPSSCSWTGERILDWLYAQLPSERRGDACGASPMTPRPRSPGTCSARADRDARGGRHLHHADDPRGAVRRPARGPVRVLRPRPAGRRDDGRILVGIVVAFVDFPTGLIIWAVVLVLYQQVENNIIQPLIYGRTVEVHPLIVIVAILIGASLLGILGALVAIPDRGGDPGDRADYWFYSDRNLARVAKQAAAAVDPDEGTSAGPRHGELRGKRCSGTTWRGRATRRSCSCTPGSATRMWGPQRESLAARGRTIRCDANGYGRSRLAPEGFSHAQGRRRAARRLVRGPAIVVGASFGGLVALDLALGRRAGRRPRTRRRALCDHEWSRKCAPSSRRRRSCSRPRTSTPPSSSACASGSTARRGPPRGRAGRRDAAPRASSSSCRCGTTPRTSSSGLSRRLKGSPSGLVVTSERRR